MHIHEIYEAEQPKNLNDALATWHRTEGRNASMYVKSKIQSVASTYKGNGMDADNAVKAAHDTLEREERRQQRTADSAKDSNKAPQELRSPVKKDRPKASTPSRQPIKIDPIIPAFKSSLGKIIGSFKQGMQHGSLK